MTKGDHIEYWLKNAKRDWNRAKFCMEQKDYLFALFCAHLCLEKLCKALWVKHHKSNYPPRIHNLEKILRSTPVRLSDNDWKFLLDMNKFQLEGRYPDYRDRIYRECTKEFTLNIFINVKRMKSCLIKELQ